MIRFIWLAVLLPAIAWGYAEGPPPGFAGVPGELGTCGDCHSGGKGSGNVSLSFAGGSTYTPGVTQQLIVTIVDSAQRRWGFELAARQSSSSSTQEGTFTAGSDGFTQVVCADNGFDEVGCPGTLEYIEHTSLGTRLGQTGSATFTFTWTPPATSAGNITFYVAANAANGDGGDGGDHIYTANFTLTPTVASNPTPQISNVVDGATFVSNTGAPSTYMSIFGTNLANPGTATDWGSSFVNGNAPTSLGGASVTVAGKAAYIAYASPTQLNIVTPATLAAGNGVPVVVTVGGQQSTPFSITIQSLTPYLFFWSLPSPNTTKYLVAQHANPTSDIGKAGLFTGNTPPTTPAKPGETIVFWGTGLGPTSPAVPPGTLATSNVQLSPLPTATVGNIPANVTFAGIPAGYCELYQVDITVPQSINTAGDYPVVLTVNGTQSFSGMVTVQP
jgi:uncharacterized protein (TIGR03437 family)